MDEGLCWTLTPVGVSLTSMLGGCQLELVYAFKSTDCRATPDVQAKPPALAGRLERRVGFFGTFFFSFFAFDGINANSSNAIWVAFEVDGIEYILALLTSCVAHYW